MSITLGAENLSALHPMTVVGTTAHHGVVGIPKAWPTTSSVELVLVLKENHVAADACVLSSFFVQVVFTRERCFRARLAGYAVLLVR